MQNARLDEAQGWIEEAQGGIKITRRNINNLRYAHSTTLIVASEKELKSLFMKVKEESDKAGKAQLLKNKDQRGGAKMADE